MQNRFQSVKNNAMIAFHQAGLRTKFPDMRQVRDVIKLFPADVRDNVHVYVSSYGDVVEYSLVLGELSGLKDDPRLLGVLEAFSGSDWEASSQDYTYSGTPNRDFRFSKKVYLQIPESNRHARWLIERDILNSFDIPVKLNVSICAYVRADSPTCRVVVKGFKEEVVRTEIREVVCE